MTLVEIIVAIALIAILFSVAVTLMNPTGQMAAARNSQRQLHLQVIMNGIRQKMADTSGGQFICAAGTLPSTSTKMSVGAGNYDMALCLIPDYVPTMPFDPSATSTRYNDNSDYDTGYTVMRNASTGQITLQAPYAELGKTIKLTR